MKNLCKIVLLFIITAISYNCSSDDSTEPMPDPDPAANPNPNKTTTYNTDIKVIIDANCISCHSQPPAQGAPMSLETYADIFAALNNQNRDDLAFRMDEARRNIMPPSGRLSQEIIDIVLDWKADGYLEE